MRPPPARAGTPSSSTSGLTRQPQPQEWRGMSGPSLAELRATGQPDTVTARRNEEHWAGRRYMRRLSPYGTWVFARLGWSPNAVTWLMIVVGVGAGAVVAGGGVAAAIAAAVMVQAYLLLACT